MGLLSIIVFRVSLSLGWACTGWWTTLAPSTCSCRACHLAYRFILQDRPSSYFPNPDHLPWSSRTRPIFASAGRSSAYFHQQSFCSKQALTTPGWIQWAQFIGQWWDDKTNFHCHQIWWMEKTSLTENEILDEYFASPLPHISPIPIFTIRSYWWLQSSLTPNLLHFMVLVITLIIKLIILISWAWVWSNLCYSGTVWVAGWLRYMLRSFQIK